VCARWSQQYAYVSPECRPTLLSAQLSVSWAPRRLGCRIRKEVYSPAGPNRCFRTASGEDNFVKMDPMMARICRRSWFEPNPFAA
jgi:hypothetical protein